MLSRLTEFRNRWRRQPSYPNSEAQWMTAEAFESDPRFAHVVEAHYTSCAKTGQRFVKPLDGRFRDLPRRELKHKIRELRQAIARAGGVPPVPDKMPRWQELEFLDNILEFEIVKPCGCDYGPEGPVVGEA